MKRFGSMALASLCLLVSLAGCESGSPPDITARQVPKAELMENMVMPLEGTWASVGPLNFLIPEGMTPTTNANDAAMYTMNGLTFSVMRYDSPGLGDGRAELEYWANSSDSMLDGDFDMTVETNEWISFMGLDTLHVLRSVEMYGSEMVIDGYYFYYQDGLFLVMVGYTDRSNEELQNTGRAILNSCRLD